MSPEECPILVVDDDPDILDSVSAILAFEGYSVECAINGAEALQAVERHRPSLVLLDMKMPILDGWGFARKLRERGVRLPIIVMTAAVDAQARAREIEADGWLPKPFELFDLLSTVQQLRPA
jgi:CheY-like chemotaxis protein